MRQSSVLALFMTFVCLSSALSAQTTSPNQDIAGSWQGAFVFDRGKVRTILYVAPRGQAGTLTSPRFGTPAGLPLVAEEFTSFLQSYSARWAGRSGVL